MTVMLSAAVVNNAYRVKFFTYSNKLGLEQPGKVYMIGQICSIGDKGSNPVSKYLCHIPVRTHVILFPLSDQFIKPVPENNHGILREVNHICSSKLFW